LRRDISFPVITHDVAKMKIDAAPDRSGLQVHFPQQGWVARVGAQPIEGGIDVEMEHRAVALVDRLLEPVEGSVDFSKAIVYRPKTPR